jgi:hypothetical protein
MKVGDACTYVDETSVHHKALITARHDGKGPDSDEDIDPKHAVNLVYVSSDSTKRDPYGQQVERASSVQGKASGVTAHGRYWE